MRLLPLALAVLLLAQGALAMPIADPQGASDMASLVAVNYSSVDWVATGLMKNAALFGDLVVYNSSSLNPILYHPTLTVFEQDAYFRVFDNGSADAIALAEAYLDNGTICNASSGTLNVSGALPSSCYIMADARNGNWVNWEENIPFLVYVFGEAVTCKTRDVPLLFHAVLIANTMKTGMDVVPGLGLGFMVDVGVTVVQSAFYIILIGTALSVVTITPVMFGAVRKE